MRLTIYTDFSLRLLTYLATHRDRVCTVKEIAAAYDISHHHLLKVANQLANDGLVEATRGKGGGLRLAKPPHRINIGAVVRLTEPDFNLVACFDGAGGGCRIESVCVLQQALQEACAAFLKVLDRYSLTDLMARKPTLVTIFESGGRSVKWMKVA